MGASIIQRIANSGFPGLGDDVYTVGTGGNFSSMSDAINAFGDRMTLVHAETENILLFTNGTSISAGAGTWRTEKNFRVGDYVEINGDGELFKIMSIATGGSIELGHQYSGSNILGDATLTFYRLNWKTLLLLAGEHTSLPSGTSLNAGIIIRGEDKFGTVLNEYDSNPQGPFVNYGENILQNLTLGPTNRWSDLDAIQNTPDTTLWGGATTFMDNVIFKFKDMGGDHGNGTGLIPVPAGGRLTMTNSLIEFEQMVQFQTGGRVTPSVTNTQINMNNCVIRNVRSWNNPDPDLLPLVASCLYADITATYNIINCDLRMEDNIEVRSVTDDPALIYANGAGTINIVNSNLYGNNSLATSPRNMHGINCPSGSTATVNLTNSNVDIITGSATGHGILTEAAGSTVNLRNTRVKGTTTAITNTAGTINESQTTLVGGTSGTVNSAAT